MEEKNSNEHGSCNALWEENPKNILGRGGKLQLCAEQMSNFSNQKHHPRKSMEWNEALCWLFLGLRLYNTCSCAKGTKN